MNERPTPRTMNVARGSRLAVFLMVVGFVLAGPVTRQVLGSKNSYLRPWRMYSGKSLGVLDIQYFDGPASDTGAVVMDRVQLLGFEYVWDAPKGSRRVNSVNQLGKELEAICGSVEGPLYAVVRRAIKSGWRTIELGEHNLCEPGALGELNERIRMARIGHRSSTPSYSERRDKPHHRIPRRPDGAERELRRRKSPQQRGKRQTDRATREH